MSESLAQGLGLPAGDVRSLEAPAIAAIIAEVSGRFRAYAALREALPFERITSDPCTAVATVDAVTVRADTDLTCALGADGGGSVSLVQRQEASGLLRFTVSYRDARAFGLSVSGEEGVSQGADGTTTHALDLVQDETPWRYTFRAGDLAPDSPVFDYLIPADGGEVPVRLTNPTTFGGFATVILFGLDGLLQCDLRASDPALGVRGTCDNGVTFGLP